MFTAKQKYLASIIVLSVESLEFSAAAATHTHTHTHTHTQHTQHTYTNQNHSANATSGIPVAAASHLQPRQPLLPLLLTPRHRLEKESRSEKCPINTAHETCTAHEAACKPHMLLECRARRLKEASYRVIASTSTCVVIVCATFVVCPWRFSVGSLYVVFFFSIPSCFFFHISPFLAFTEDGL